ncbi:MAG TPA: peptidylprolyl isomerase [Sediminispirochaeta sp.]|nr:peptidylprolyl isomerase [Sediminispirochaeta sp.]
MSKRVIFFFLLIFFLGTVFPAATQVLGKTVATVNLTRTVGITEAQVKQRMEELRRIGADSGLRPENIGYEQVLESMIAEILIRQAAERDGIEVPENNLEELFAQQKRQIEMQLGREISASEFRSIVQQETGYSWAEYRDQLENQVLQQTYISQKKRSLFDNIKTPTTEEIEELYQANATNFTNPEYVRISHLFISTQEKTPSEIEEARDKIQEASKKLKTGEMTFDDLVRSYSEDENSRFRGGDVGYVTRNNQQVREAYGRHFFDTVFQLKKGDVSGVIESNIGFHIVKVTEHSPAKILELDERIAPDYPVTVREYLRNRLYQERQQDALRRATQEVMAELRDEAEIVRYDN